MAQGATLPGFSVLEYHPGNAEFPTLPADPALVLLKQQLDISLGDTVQRELGLRHSSTGAGVVTDKSGFADWYLETLWLTPSLTDFGNIIDNKTEFVVAHNTRRVAQSFDSSNLTPVPDITLDDPSLPVSIGAFSSQILTLTAAALGVASFDDFVTFTFSLDGALTYRLQGRRVLFFAVFPQNGIREQLLFKTDVMRSKDGTEQVFALRLAPRAKVKMKVKFNDDAERTRATNIVFGGAPALNVGFQLWWEAVETAVLHSATATVIAIDTTAASWAIGDTASFVLPDRTTVEGEVDSFTASQIVLTTMIGAELPAGTSVMPARFGFFSTAVSHSISPVNLEEIDVEWTASDESYLGAIDPAYFDSHPIDGLPIIKKRWLLKGKARASTKREQRILDGQTGVVAIRGSEALAEYATSVVFPLESQAETFAYRRFLHFLHGSWGKFYMPTFQNDLPLNAQLALGGNQIVIKHMDVKLFLDGAVPKRDLRIVTEDGTIYYRRITGIVDNATFETITVDAVIGSTGFSQPESTTISWMHLSRINGDVATFTHRFKGRADLRFSTRSVKE